MERSAASEYRFLAVETVARLETVREKGKKPNDYLVGVAGSEPGLC
jgi:hypothetical protein